MKFYSTKNKSVKYSLREAVLKGLPDDNGLFMPERFDPLPPAFFNSLQGLDPASVGLAISNSFMKGDIPEDRLESICTEAFNFPVPVVRINDHTFIAELFHGPTLAFKDFGARFMARIMSYLNAGENKKLTILVATSGDTGSAVADGFFGVEGIEVFILYPSGGVSELQEKQLTTYGDNIHAIEVKGTFDDCQRMVKTAFLDRELSSSYRLTSANSINISRLIPQSLYYFSSLAASGADTVVVPSGNFGNLTAGLFARKLGLPVKHFVAATNANDSVPKFLSGQNFSAHPSIATISNAMDVGNPSNFGRMLDLFNDSRDEMKKAISAYSVTDDDTRIEMLRMHRESKYVCDPHGAVGISAWNRHLSRNPGSKAVVLETAHPAKFLETVENTLSIKLTLPEALERISKKKKSASLLSSEFADFKDYLQSLK